MTVRMLLAAILFTAALPAAAQTADPPFPVEGTVIKVSPVFGPREDVRAPVVTLPGGTTVRVLGREGFWFRVGFSTALGEREGLMEPSDILIAPDAVSLGDVRTTPVFSERGFMEVRTTGFPQIAPNDASRSLGDVLVRQEAFVRPARWFQLSMGIDLRESSQEAVEDTWQVDIEDRGILRPRAAVRRLAVSLSSRHVSVDVGKQFIRWGRADILSPVDRFSPRDFVNVLDSEFLPVIGARTAVRVGGETFEAVWAPQMTPSRMPLLGRRWTVVPPEAAGLAIDDRGAVYPTRSEYGFRWSHSGRFEMGLSLFDGFNHLPDIAVDPEPELGRIGLTRFYPALRSYGGEVAVPTSAFTVRGEAAWFTSPELANDEYVLYVAEIERQMGEWLITAGYTGEVVTAERSTTTFAAERGVANAVIGRASYTIDPRRTFSVEGAARRNGRGVFVRGEYSQAVGHHFRLTLAAAGIGGRDDDFLGQYQRNSHVSAALRFSY